VSPKRVYASEAESWIHNYPGFGISQSDICLIFRNGYENIAKMKIAKNYFKLQDYSHLTQMFFYEDFHPSEVISRPQGNL
jgi:hypothetical protein